MAFGFYPFPQLTRSLSCARDCVEASCPQHPNRGFMPSSVRADAPHRRMASHNSSTPCRDHLFSSREVAFGTQLVTPFLHECEELCRGFISSSIRVDAPHRRMASRNSPSIGGTAPRLQASLQRAIFSSQDPLSRSTHSLSASRSICLGSEQTVPLHPRASFNTVSSALNTVSCTSSAQ